MNDTIGFLGLGAMGMPMACNLVERGYRVCAWDPREAAREAFVLKGGQSAGSQEEACTIPVVLLSLPHSEVLVEVAESALLPNAQEGQVFVDFTTVLPRQARRLGEQFTAAGACYLDCPVTGGPGGVSHRVLRLFVGGERSAFDRVQAMLADISEAKWVFYCGESGCGQSVKGVNQLGMGLIQAAAMEAVNYGTASGISPELLSEAIGGESGFRGILRTVCQRVADGTAGGTPIKYDQFDFFLDEAQERGFELPIVRHLYQILHDEPKPVRDANQDAPSYWDYLVKKPR